MNEKYIVGVAVGFAIAYLLLNKPVKAAPIKPGPVRPGTIPPTKAPGMPPAVGYGGGYARVAIRPWSQQLPLHA